MSDAPFITDSNLCLALETEHRRLELATVVAGVKALLSDPAKGIYFVAESDGTLAGQLLITYEWSDWRNGNFWWIQSVYVLETFRGSGVFAHCLNTFKLWPRRAKMSAACGFTWIQPTQWRENPTNVWE